MRILRNIIATTMLSMFIVGCNTNKQATNDVTEDVTTVDDSSVTFVVCEMVNKVTVVDCEWNVPNSGQIGRAQSPTIITHT